MTCDNSRSRTANNAARIDSNGRIDVYAMHENYVPAINAVFPSEERGTIPIDPSKAAQRRLVSAFPFSRNHFSVLPYHGRVLPRVSLGPMLISHDLCVFHEEQVFLG